MFHQSVLNSLLLCALVRASSQEIALGTTGDDKPSRQQHENGLRHKGNWERYIRYIYKEGERDKKNKAEEEREIKRISQVSLVFF